MPNIIIEIKENKAEIMELKASNEKLRNENGKMHKKIYHLEKENEKLRNTVKYIIEKDRKRDIQP